MRAETLHHLAIKTTKVETLGSFYGEVLGLEELTRHHDERGLRSIWLKMGDGILMIERLDRQVSNHFGTQPGYHLLAFKINVQTRQAWEEKLQAHNCKVVRQSPYTLYCLDPDGNRVGLSHWPEATAVAQ